MTDQERIQFKTDCRAEANSLIRSRNNFFYRLRKHDGSREDLIKWFEEDFGISRAEADNQMVFTGSHEEFLAHFGVKK